MSLPTQSDFRRLRFRLSPELRPCQLPSRKLSRIPRIQNLPIRLMRPQRQRRPHHRPLHRLENMCSDRAFQCWPKVGRSYVTGGTRYLPRDYQQAHEPRACVLGTSFKKRGQMHSTSSGETAPEFESAADGYEILITWPEFREGRHDQAIWYAHIGGQTEAVRLVQQASGALNDAKIEILGPATGDFLNEHGVARGDVRRATGRFEIP